MEKVNDCTTSKKMQRKKLLVIINPYSGHGKALKAWKKVSLAIEKDNGLLCDVVNSKAAGHAKDLARTANLRDYGGIVVVSGDGMLFEVINGLYQRPDWPVEVPIGIIPGGSGNGIHHSLLYQMEENFHQEISVACQNIVSGKASPVDLIEIETRETRLVSMLGVCWGLLSHTEMKAENLRWVPSKWSHMRQYLCIACWIAFPQEYHGSVSYHPLDKDTDGNPIGAPDRQLQMPNLSDPVPEHWITLKGPFVMVYACNQSWLDGTCLLCPSSRLDDGVIWLVVVHSGMTRRQMLDWLLNTQTARHLHMDKYVRLIPVRCFRIVPDKGSQYLLSDAEPVDDGPVQGQIRPRVCPLMVRKELQPRTDRSRKL